MILTKAQLELRKHHLGASESAAVLGLSPWATPNDVYWRKVAPDAIDDEDPTDAMKAGIRWEPTILDWAADELGCEIRRDMPSIVEPERGILLATPDGEIVGKKEGVEAKMSGLPDEWGPEGTEEIPTDYIVQCQQQMYLMEWDRVWVAAMLVIFRRVAMRMYCVDRNQEFIDFAVAYNEGWWNDHVVARVPPEDSPPPESILKRLHRSSGSRVILGENGIKIHAAWEAAKVIEKTAKNVTDHAKREVLALFGLEEPAEEALLPNGDTLTYRSQRSTPSFDHKRLRADLPKVAAKYSKQGSHRVLRIKKAPKISMRAK